MTAECQDESPAPAPGCGGIVERTARGLFSAARESGLFIGPDWDDLTDWDKEEWRETAQRFMDRFCVLELSRD